MVGMSIGTGAGRDRPGRRLPLSVALLLLVLLGGTVALTTHSSAVAADKARQNAQARAEITADDLDRTFTVWRTELLVAAADPALSNWYRRPEDRARLRPQVNRALMTLHKIEPASIDEACLIDADGREWARQVKGTAGAPSEMSPDESVNPFFAVTMELPEGQVRHNPPYLSPDSHRWVISNSTPLIVDRKRVGMVHFEANLEVIHAQLVRAAGPGRVIEVVDPATGEVVADSRSREQIVAQPFVRAADRPIPQGWETATVRLRGAEGIANRWQVVVAVAPSSSWDIGLILRIATLLALGVVCSVLLRLASQLRPERPAGTASDAPRARLVRPWSP